MHWLFKQQNLIFFMPKPRLYSEMKKKLRAKGIGPLFSTEAKKRGFMRQPSIPQMHPTIKGATASKYRRIGRPVVQKVHGVSVTDLKLKFNIRKNSRRSGTGKGSSGGERVSHATGSATARRISRTKFSSTRGARPRREQKKTAKK
mgnify:FL=1